MQLVPPTAKQVLHIGCGRGQLAAALREQGPERIVGLESDPEALEEAGNRLEAVARADREYSQVALDEESFDSVLITDALQRVRSPLGLLRRARSWLSAEGELVLRVPNVRRQATVRRLVEGTWQPQDEGADDENAIRYFTQRELEKLLYRAGFEVTRTEALPGEGDQAWKEQGRPTDIQLGRLRLTGLGAEDAEQFHADALLVAAHRMEVQQYEPTSIILVTHNQLALTRQCLDSIRFVTDEPYELIVVDNGSTDGTVGYLRSHEDVHLIENSANRGFPAAANQGLQAATGRQLLLLNNDVVVTTGWLRRQLETLYSQQSVGLVGPCSNCVSGPQQIPVTYRDLASLEGFAWEWGKANDGVRVSSDRLVGFCLLLRREVIEQVGLLDERFGIGNFEDDDFCLRAGQTGFRLLNARDAFIHHWGHATFLAAGIDYRALMQRNRRHFHDKWRGAQVSSPKEATTGDVQQDQMHGTEATPVGDTRSANPAPAGDVELSVCLIVRDNEDTIEPCLESIRPWVDEMVVVDTGSQDRTPEICRELGARMFYFPWCDDFSAARNESFRHARGRWLFWMDSDDTIDEENGRKLRKLAQRNAPDHLLGYVVQVHCPGPGDQGHHDVTIVDHVKLVRNLPQLRFEGRIHEQLLPAIRAAGGDVAWSELFVVHSGADHSPQGKQRKLQRDLHLLELELRDRPDHPFGLFNLG